MSMEIRPTPLSLPRPASAALRPDCADEDEPVDSAQVPREPPPSTGVDYLAPRGATPAEQFEHYRQVIESHGGAINPDGATVLAIRGENPEGAIHRTVVCKGYADTMVVLNRSADGSPQVTTLPGSTYPSQTSYAKRGVSIVQPGSFRAIPHRIYKNMPSYYVLNPGQGDGNLPSWRDLDMDGTFSAEERQVPFTASAILFHSGNADGVSSAGCQNLSPARMEQFIAAVGGPNASFLFTMVETGGY